MSHPFEGVMRVINVSAVSSGAGATTVTLRPATGRVWELLSATGQQDDGAVGVAWNLVDPDATVNLYSITSAGAGYKWSVYQLNDLTGYPVIFPAPMVLTYDRYLTYVFTASAGAKNGSVVAVVREYRGVAMEV